MVYLAAEAALTVLEVRVHLDLPLELLPDDYVLLTIEVDELPAEQGPALTAYREYRTFGDRWLAEQRTALLTAPSVIVPESHNVLLNPSHPDAVAVRMVNTRPWRFDPRLF